MPEERLSGGPLLAAISTRIVSLSREHYGRGPMRSKTYVLDDLIVCVMRGSGYTTVEQTLMDAGEAERVVALREDFQAVMESRFRTAIEELTGSQVLAFVSRAHVEPELTVEMFLLDQPPEGFGPEASEAA